MDLIAELQHLMSPLPRCHHAIQQPVQLTRCRTRDLITLSEVRLPFWNDLFAEEIRSLLHQIDANFLQVREQYSPFFEQRVDEEA